MKFFYFCAHNNSQCFSLRIHIPSEFEHIDVLEQPDLIEKYQITSVPLFMAVDEDTEKEIDRFTTTSIPHLKFWMKGVLNGKRKEKETA